MFDKPHVDKTTDDLILLQLLKKGSKEAFTILYERYNKQLYVLAFSYLKDKDMAEDVVQHVFTKLWEYHVDLSIKISLKNFLYTITKNHLLNIIRKENNTVKKNYELAQSMESEYDNLMEVIERKELTSIYKQALDLLPPQKKMVCILKFEDKLSNQEIADKMDISINTVKTHYLQSIKLLRIHINKMLIYLILVTLFY